MSKYLKALAILGTVFAGAPVWARGTIPQGVAQAIQATTHKFEKEHKDVSARYTGIKGWPVGGDYLVRVYLTNDQSLKYSCYEHEMDGHEMMMCEEAN